MDVAAVDRVTWGVLRGNAQRLRRRALAAGEPGLSLRVVDLLEQLPLPYEPNQLPEDATAAELAESAREPLDFVDDVLKRHGIGCRPAPADAGSDGTVVLRPSNRFALQGALTIGLLALIASVGVSKVAFLVFVPVVALGVWLVWRQSSRVDRFAPRFVPRGRILGALLLVVLLGIATVGIVQPARTWMRNRGDVTNAIALSAQADAQLAAGDVPGARASVDQALQIEPGLGSVQATAQKVIVAESAANLSTQLAAQAAYQRAEAAFAKQEWQTAIEQMTALGSFADAPQRLAQYRATAATTTLAQARQALAAGDAQQAMKLAGTAASFDPSVRDRQLMQRIFAALTAG